MDIPWSRLDTRVDLYALGAILEWLFRPELDESTEPPLETLRRVISRSHAHDAGARYSSSDAMLRDLEKAHGSDDVEAGDSLSEDLRAFAIQHPKATILGGLAVVTMLAAIITLISQLA